MFDWITFSNDTLIVTGLILLMLAVPSGLAAAIDGRRPRIMILSVLVAAGLFFLAHTRIEGGLTAQMIPDAVINTIALIVN